MPADEVLRLRDRKTYSVYGSLAAGSRFTDDYDEENAVPDYPARARTCAKIS